MTRKARKARGGERSERGGEGGESERRTGGRTTVTRVNGVDIDRAMAKTLSDGDEGESDGER